MSELLKEIDELMKHYECKYHTWPSNENPHGCTDCYNTGYIFDNPETPLLVKAYDHIHSLTAENEKLKRIVEVLEKSNEFYARGSSWQKDYDMGEGMDYYTSIIGKDWEETNEFTKFGGQTARQAKEEVERIRNE